MEPTQANYSGSCMARTYKAGVLITGDSKGAVKAVNLTAKEVSSLDKTTQKSSGRIQKSLDNVTGSLMKMQTRAAAWGATFAAAGVAATTALVKSGLQTTDSLAKTADKLGVTTEALARYRFAAAQTGVDQNKADVALQRFTRRLADAAAGTGPAVKAFNALGLEAKELVELSPDEALAKVADKMRTVENQSQKVSLAFKLFDSEGVNLVNTLELGSEGLANLGSQADAAGLSVSRIDAAKVEAANDAMARVKAGITGLSQQLAVQFAPLLTDIANRLFGIGQESGGMAAAAGKAFNFVIKATGVMANGIRGLNIAWVGMQNIVQRVARFVIASLDKMAKGVFELWQKLPWVDKAQYESQFDGFLLSMDSAVEQTAERLRELAETPLPSQQIENYVDNLERAFESSAEVAAKTQAIVQKEVISTAEVTESLATTTKKSTAETSKAWEGMRGILSNFFTDIATDGNNAFDTLLGGFKGLISKMGAEAATNAIKLNLDGLLEGGGPLSGILGKLGIGGEGGLSGIFDQLGGADSLGAGAIGSGIGNAVFGETSGIGSGVLGLAGAFIGGPLGAGIGAFIGAGVEKGLGKVFGFNQNNGDNPGFTTFDFATGNRASQGVGKSFNEENVAASSNLVDLLATFAESIGGTNFSGKLQIGDNKGVSFEGLGAAGQFGTDTDAALAFGFQQIVKEATNLNEALKPLIANFRGTGEEIARFAVAVTSLDTNAGINSVTQAINEFSTAAPTFLQKFETQAAALDGFITSVDGSVDSVERVAQAFELEKVAAYEFAVAIQQAGASLKSISDDQAASIRDSVLTQDQLRSRRKTERDDLLKRLQGGEFTDPARIEEVGRRIFELNDQVFRSLSEELRLQDFEKFAALAETTGDTIDDIFSAQVRDLEQRQDTRNDQIETVLQSLTERQEQAATTFQTAVTTFGNWVAALPGGGNTFLINELQSGGA